MHRFFIFAILIFLISGCAQQKQYVKVKEINPDIFKTKIAYKAPEHQSEGSIWPGDNVRKGKLFEDRKAHYLGDIVTVVISEDISAVGEADTDINGKNEDSYSFPYIGGKDASKWSRNWKLFLKNSRSNKFSGKGKTSRRNKMKAVLSARIVEILPNGNLRIAGKKYITINGEKQYIFLTGIVRPDDIRFDNTIESKYIADVQIEYSGKGVLAAKQKTGWGTKILNLLWPF